jgi:hypothetical protein
MSDILLELQNIRSYSRLKGKSSKQIQEAFFANYLTGMLFIRLKDLRSLKMLGETKEKYPTKLTSSLNDISYWAKCVFDSKKDKKLESVVGKNIFSGIHLSRADSMKDKIYELLSSIKKQEAHINWRRNSSILKFLADGIQYKSHFFDVILPVLTEWETIDDSKKSLVIGLCYNYLLQVDQDSKFFERLKVLSNKLILNTGNLKFTGYKKLTEDEAISAGNIASGSFSAIGNTVLSRLGIINSPEKDKSIQSLSKKFKFQRLGNKIVKKRKKTFIPILYKDPSKA